MTEENAVQSESTNAGVEGARAMAAGRGLDGEPRISVAMPLDWMVRGYARAVRRFDEAAVASSDDARDGSIALFEASKWIDSLGDRAKIRDDEMVQGLRFVRHRTHHHFADAVYFDPANNAWSWKPESNLPLPTKERHRGEKQKPFYEKLAGKPVRDVLADVERLVVALAPTADLT